MKQHMGSAIVPIVKNAVEAAVLLAAETDRMYRGFAEVDNDPKALIDTEEVQACIDRMRSAETECIGMEKRVRRLCAEAAALGCDTSMSDTLMRPEAKAYEKHCQNLLGRIHAIDGTLLKGSKELREGIKSLTHITRSATKPINPTMVPGKSASELSAADLDSLAWMAIAGDFGNGEERKAALGDLYDAVQGRVNELWSCNGGPKEGVTVPADRERVDISTFQNTHSVVYAEWAAPSAQLPFSPSEVSGEERIAAPHTDFRNTIYKDLNLDPNHVVPYVREKEEQLPFRNTMGRMDQALTNPSAKLPLTPSMRDELGSFSTRVDENGTMFGMSYADPDFRIQLGNKATEGSVR